jgi:hypothetical protein
VQGDPKERLSPKEYLETQVTPVLQPLLAKAVESNPTGNFADWLSNQLVVHDGHRRMSYVSGAVGHHGTGSAKTMPNSPKPPLNKKASYDGKRAELDVNDSIKEFEDRHDLILKTKKEMFGDKPISASDRAQVMRTLASSVAPMLVTPFTKLKGAYDTGKIAEQTYKNIAIDLQDLPGNGKIIFISHRWWSSGRAEPDQVANGWPKADFILNTFVPKVCKDNGWGDEDVYLW